MFSVSWHMLFHFQIEVLKTLTLESLRNWFMQYFGDNQRKLSIQVSAENRGK